MCRIIVHILQHLPNSVEEWGPLTYHSAFLFEDASGMLLKMFGGTQCIPQQIMKYYPALRKLDAVAALWLQGADEQSCMFFEELTRADVKYRVQKALQINLCTALGAPTTRTLSVLERIIVQDFFHLRQLLPQRLHCFYERIVINNRLFTTAQYAKQFKTNNYVCCLNTAYEFCRIQAIFVMKCCDCESVLQCGCCEVIICFVNMLKCNIPQVLCLDNFVDANSSKFVVKCLLSPDTCVIGACDIGRKCFSYDANSFTYITVLPAFELD